MIHFWGLQCVCGPIHTHTHTQRTGPLRCRLTKMPCGKKISGTRLIYGGCFTPHLLQSALPEPLVVDKQLVPPKREAGFTAATQGASDGPVTFHLQPAERERAGQQSDFHSSVKETVINILLLLLLIISSGVQLKLSFKGLEFSHFSRNTTLYRGTFSQSYLKRLLQFSVTDLKPN